MYPDSLLNETLATAVFKNIKLKVVSIKELLISGVPAGVLEIRKLSIAIVRDFF